MAETADKALDLADKWAQQIGAKLSAAAPGAKDIALEAVTVKIVSEIMGWLLLLFLFFAVGWIFRWFMKSFSAVQNKECKKRDEEVPFGFGMVVSGFFLTFIGIGVAVSFPKQEIAGLFAPRGYVALMVLDSIKK